MNKVTVDNKSAKQDLTSIPSLFKDNSLKKMLRITILIYWVILLLGITSLFTPMGKLPMELLDWENKQENISLAIIYSNLLVLILLLVSTLGLFFFKRWAKILYIITLPPAMLIPVSYGPFVATALVSILSDFESLISGFLLALLLFLNTSSANIAVELEQKAAAKRKQVEILRRKQIAEEKREKK